MDFNLIEPLDSDGYQQMKPDNTEPLRIANLNTGNSVDNIWPDLYPSEQQNLHNGGHKRPVVENIEGYNEAPELKKHRGMPQHGPSSMQSNNVDAPSQFPLLDELEAYSEFRRDTSGKVVGDLVGSVEHDKFSAESANPGTGLNNQIMKILGVPYNDQQGNSSGELDDHYLAQENRFRDNGLKPNLPNRFPVDQPQRMHSGPMIPSSSQVAHSEPSLTISRDRYINQQNFGVTGQSSHQIQQQQHRRHHHHHSKASLMNDYFDQSQQQTSAGLSTSLDPQNPDCVFQNPQIETEKQNTPSSTSCSSVPLEHHNGIISSSTTQSMYNRHLTTDQLRSIPSSFSPTLSASSSYFPPQNIPQVNLGSSVSTPSIGIRNTAKRFSASPYISATAAPLQRAIRFSNYKAKSSIPPELSSHLFAEQCMSAAVSSRVPPTRLHHGEHALLRSHLKYVHVTTYLNIRNGILRLWLSNPSVNVTISEAAGCARDPKFFGLAEVAYHWLFRMGFINFGCLEYPQADSLHDATTPSISRLSEPDLTPVNPKKPRLNIIVIGAGIAGIGCARQLDNLLHRYSNLFSEYEDIPRIVVLEGRRRIGGRIYSVPLKTSKPENSNQLVDLGAQAINGFGNGNPLAVLIRRQLGLPVVPADPPTEIYDSRTSSVVDEKTAEKGDILFRHVMDKAGQFSKKIPKPTTARGDEALMWSSRDSAPSEPLDTYPTIAFAEEEGTNSKPYEDPGLVNTKDKKTEEEHAAQAEIQFLSDLGFTRKESDNEEVAEKIEMLAEPHGEPYPNLGCTLNKFIEKQATAFNFSDTDMRLLNWHMADLENSLGTNLKELSLSGWDRNEGWNELTGSPCVLKNGMISLVHGLFNYPERLDLRFKAVVKVIEHDDSGSQIILENGDQIAADRIVCTLPLGVLKDRSVQFIPDLPQWKTDSIERLGFGVINKVCLVYEEEFWDPESDIFCIAQDCLDSSAGIQSSQESFEQNRGHCFIFRNNSRVVGKPCLLGIVSGAAAVAMANETDDTIIEKSLCSLQSALPKCRDHKIVESIVSRWQMDPFSRGAFSYVGHEATEVDYDLLARPIRNCLFFAGEATCRPRPGTVHGAYISGLRAAKEVINSLIGEIEVPDPLILSGKELCMDAAQPLQRPHIAPYGSYNNPEGLNPDNQLQITPAEAHSLLNEGQSSASSYISHPAKAVRNGARSVQVSLTGPTGFNDSSMRKSNMMAVVNGSHAQNCYSPESTDYPLYNIHAPHGAHGLDDSADGLREHGLHSQPQQHASRRIQHHQDTRVNHLQQHNVQYENSPANGNPGRISEENTQFELRLKQLREERANRDMERMKTDLIRSLGKRPVKPDREGANPFLIFQKDFWDKCKENTDKSIRAKTGDPSVKASRNEVRSALGKMWRELPAADKAPYLKLAQESKDSNIRKVEEYRQRAKQYDSDAEEFRNRWKEEYGSVPSEEELRIIRILHKDHNEKSNRRSRWS